MSLNSQSNTSPTGSTQTLNSYYDPYDRSTSQSNFQGQYDYEGAYGGHFPGRPYRPAEYLQNANGVRFWQTWDTLGGLVGPQGWENRYRSLVTNSSANNTSLLILSRNQPDQYAPAPIAIGQYALATQQVYVGSDFSGGGYG